VPLQAYKCFGRAGSFDLEIESEALYLSCQKTKDVYGTERRMCFLDAGEKFLCIGMCEKAARCFYEAAEYELAGKAFMICSKGKHEENIRYAIGCYRKAGMVTKCVDALVQSGKIKMALKILLEDSQYEKAFSLISDHPDVSLTNELSLDALAKKAAVVYATAKEAAVLKR
jgi:hypothetical protein